MAEGIKKLSENVIAPDRALIITNPSVPDNDAITIGALQSNPATRGLKIKTAKGTYSKLNAAEILEELSITTELLNNQCVTKDKIANNAVGHDQLEDDAICEWKLKANSVTRDKIKNEEVIQGKLGANAVLNINLNNECVTNDKIALGTIENDRLFEHTITNKKIALGTIIEETLGPECVTNKKIANNTIKNEKYEQYSIYGDKIKNEAIENIHLGINSVNTKNILDGAINDKKICENAIYEKHIDDKQIITRHLHDESVTSLKLGNDSVTTIKIHNSAVTIPKLGQDVIDLIGNPVQYDSDNNVQLKRNLNVKGNIVAEGTIRADKIYNAVFMDLAEAYTPAPEETFVPGDIVELRENGFVYRASSITDNKVIVGVVSNEYAQCFGATEEDLATNQKVAVGMIGKVHVNVTGPVKIGEYIGVCKDGIGISKNLDLTLQQDQIIGKALETNNSHDPKKVLCLIFPN